MIRALTILTFLFLLLAAFPAGAQTLYKYKDEHGNWQFSDRPPADQRERESERLSGGHSKPDVTILQENTANGTQLIATNEWHCPVELEVRLTKVKNISRSARKPFRTVLPARSELDLFEITPADVNEGYSYEMEYAFMPGDPTQEHHAPQLYHMPYAKGTSFQVTQAFPSKITHGDAASRHAIDFAMPEGTPVYAARAGTVISTEYGNFTGGTDTEDLPKANTVRIAHDDGTIGVYAHLAWNAIRVRTGQTVRRGQYIANSGNTGFSSGPHLHFVVMANVGMKFKSVPVLFEGASGRAVTARTGEDLLNIE